MSKFSIKNVSTANTVLVCENLRFRRELAPNRSLNNLDQETFEELCAEPGIQVMIANGFLKVKADDEAGQEIIKESAAEADREVLSYDEVKEIFANKDYTKFTKTIANATPATKDNFVRAAVEMKIVDNGFTALIKKYCGVDVMQAITIDSQTEK